MTFWHHGPGRRLVWASMSHTPWLWAGLSHSHSTPQRGRSCLPASRHPQMSRRINPDAAGRTVRATLGQGKNSLHRNPDREAGAAAAPMHSEPRPEGAVATVVASRLRLPGIGCCPGG